MFLFINQPNLLGGTGKNKGCPTMPKNNFQKVKNMISYKYKMKVWPNILFHSLVNEENGKRLGSNEKLKS